MPTLKKMTIPILTAALLVGAAIETNAIPNYLAPLMDRGGNAVPLDIDAKGETTIGQIVPGNWETYCILLPYTTSARASELVGFGINIDRRSDIAVSDSINLIVAANSDDRNALYEVGLDQADFSRIGSRCLDPDTRLHIAEPGHPYVRVAE